MKERLRDFLKVLVPFSLVLYAVQYLLLDQVFPIELFYPVWVIYLFLVLTTLGIFAVLVFVQKNFSDKTGFAFMGLSLFKMFLAIVFLLPLMLSKNTSPFSNIMAFFIPYFFYLTLETWYAIKLLNKQ